MLSDSIKGLKLESKVIMAFIIVLTIITASLGLDTYQDLSIKQETHFSVSAKVESRNEVIPINANCRNFNTQYLIAKTTNLWCSYNYGGGTDRGDFLENYSLNVEIVPVDRGIGSSIFEGSISSTEVEYSRNQRSGSLLRPPESSGRYLLTLELENSSKAQKIDIESSSSRYLRYYRRSEITGSKYRSALFMFNILILGSFILQARSLILRIEER